ncbi:hypothetical protein PROFUN_14973 [Planoprotostelium fungivorum]|uniref:Uncharacterized protein n=1 Tax=Planoprotostelium fungivorum TaxID=1890364 RepID=A0A2P6MY57_9EUKA|nr:hypothetical protein PROFUN_14973 [Planoprotostelium fungivorum]
MPTERLLPENSDFEGLIQRYKQASKLGFQYAQWDLQSLQQYMTNRHQQLYRKIKKVFTAINQEGFLIQ